MYLHHKRYCKAFFLYVLKPCFVLCSSHFWAYNAIFLQCITATNCHYAEPCETQRCRTAILNLSSVFPVNNICIHLPRKGQQNLVSFWQKKKNNIESDQLVEDSQYLKMKLCSTTRRDPVQAHHSAVFTELHFYM